jgi:hypothetical protein
VAKFTTIDPDDDYFPVKPAMDQVQAINGIKPPPAPFVNPTITTPVAPTAIPVMTIADPNAMMAQQTAQVQAQASVGLAQASIDNKVVDEQIKKEEEHWVRAYWRPAMGWLYMAICAFDFILFPLLAMFLPVIDKGFGLNITYTPWQSLTLSNGGLMHLAFGAILGVSAWTRGQEKIQTAIK